MLGSDFCRGHGGRQPAFVGAPPSGTLPQYVDGPALRKLGFTEATVRFLFRKLPVVAFPDHRKPHLRGPDVQIFIDEYTQQIGPPREVGGRQGSAGT